MAGEREIRIRFTGENGVLKGQAGELRTLFSNLQNDVDDTRSAGEKWADAYEQQTDRIRQEIEATVRAANALSQALGPDMVAALEASGRSVEDEVTRLRKLGLSSDEIVQSSDRIAGALRSRDDMIRQGQGQVGDGFRRIAGEADNTRSVVANFAGNAAQQLPMVAGSMGPMNMAMGQFAEYAAEGNIRLKSLAMAAPALLVAGAILSQFAKDAERAAKIKEFRTDSIEAYTESLREGGDAASAVADQIEQAGGKVEAVTGMIKEFGDANFVMFQNVHDITEVLARAGVTTDTFARSVAGGEEGLAELEAALKAAGVSGTDYDTVISAVITKQDEMAQAAKVNAELAKVNVLSQEQVNEALDEFLERKDPVGEFPDEFRRIADAISNETAPSVEDMRKVTEGLNITTDEAMNIASDYADTLEDEAATAADEAAQAAEDHAAALEAEADAAEEAEDALRDLQNARLGAIDSTWGAIDAQRAWADSLATLAEGDDPATEVDEYAESLDAATRSALDNAKAHQQMAIDQAIAGGRALTAAEENQVLVDKLFEMASTLAPGSPLRYNLEQYALYLAGGVPTEVHTKFTLEGTDDAQTRIDRFRDNFAQRDPVVIETEADTADAESDIDHLHGTVDALPDQWSLTLRLLNLSGVLSGLDVLKGRLREVEYQANRTDVAVARVAD